jgi:hypothetical protein
VRETVRVEAVGCLASDGPGERASSDPRDEGRLGQRENAGSDAAPFALFVPLASEVVAASAQLSRIAPDSEFGRDPCFGLDLCSG